MLYPAKVLLVILPLCSCFTPTTLTHRHWMEATSQLAATKIRRGGKNDDKQKPEVSERIREAALSIIALSAPVLMKDPVESTAIDKQESTDTFESLFDEDDADSGANDSETKSPSTIATSNGKTTSAKTDSINTPTIQSKMPSKAQAQTETPAVIKPPEDAKPKLSVDPTAATPKPSWGDLLVKNGEMPNQKLSTLERLEVTSFPAKEELRLKSPKNQNNESLEDKTDTSTPETESLEDSTPKTLDSSTEITVDKKQPITDARTTLKPPLSPAVSTLFGKQLQVTAEGLPPLRKWPKREPEETTIELTSP